MTPHDRYQRRIDLAGEIKQADELVHECRVDVEAKQKALALAEQALERQIGLRAEKHDEARRLAKEAHDDFMSLVPEPESASAAREDGVSVVTLRDGDLVQFEVTAPIELGEEGANVGRQSRPRPSYGRV